MAMMKLKCCPFCGGKAHWRKGSSDVKMNDNVTCQSCFAEIDGDYEPLSALKAWNERISYHYDNENDTEVEC